MAKIADRRGEWFDIWFEDRKCILDIMIRNMLSDLDNGYDYYGKSIREQREMIDAYKAETDRALDMFKDMDENQVDRWCFYDLKKRGVID